MQWMAMRRRDGEATYDFQARVEQFVKTPYLVAMSDGMVWAIGDFSSAWGTTGCGCCSSYLDDDGEVVAVMQLPSCRFDGTFGRASRESCYGQRLIKTPSVEPLAVIGVLSPGSILLPYQTPRAAPFAIIQPALIPPT